VQREQQVLREHRPVAPLYTLLAVVAFAANSVLCRLALQGDSIDPATFTTIRLASGAATLLLLVRLNGDAAARLEGSWTSSAMLFLYAVPFAFAYAGMSAGTGAIILFGTVQLTLMTAAVDGGERLRAVQWIGIGVACAGLVYLVLPGVAAPPPLRAALMVMAALAWGVYTLRGRGSANPLAHTAGNFVRSVPLACAVSLVAWRYAHAEPRGVVLAVLSGAVASGLGYVAWYTALRTLTAARAAVVQLSVPVLAAFGGVIVLDEPVSMRLVLSSILVLGGIAATIWAAERYAGTASAPSTPAGRPSSLRRPIRSRR
jgi:drug/metabolite transporter (DMT)-like permease